MLLWLAVQFAAIYVCRGYNEDANRSKQPNAEDRKRIEDSKYSVTNAAVATAETDDDQLNHQIILLSQYEELGNKGGMQRLQDVEGWLQNSAPLSDTDHIHRLLQKVVNSTLRSESTDITFQSTTSLEYLEELRDYLHEMDNAVDFGKMGGLSIMLQLVLDYSFIEVRTSAVWTIGLACQNNPELIGLAHGISTVQNMLYLLKSSGPTHDDTGYPKIDLMDIESVNLLSKLIWTLSSLTRQNEESYAILKEHNGADVLYDWIMEIYSFWNLHRDDPRLLSDLYKNKMVEKVLMFASDVVVLNPEQRLFVNDNWCNVFAAHFNYAQHLWREITLAYWDIAVRKLFCVNCIPFGNGKGPRSVPHQALSIDIGLNKLKNMKIEDDFDLEIRNKAIRLLHIIDSQA